jgi:RNA polymerase sigma-70 factor, ECF subfamily
MKTILERVAGGEAQAFEDCVEVYGGLIWSMARRRGLKKEDSEDIVQDVFLELWRSARRYDPTLASEPAFVAMISRRRLIDNLRRDLRRPLTQEMAETLEDLPDDAQNRLENRVEASFASRALAVLKPAERKVLLLSTLQGLSHGQIAEKTGLPLGTVKTYIRRGLMRVREMLEKGRAISFATPLAV